MKCLHLSDTHGYHTALSYPSAGDGFDVMIHSGDLSLRGNLNECLDFINHANNLVSCGIFKHVVFTPGNHDHAFEDADDLAELRAYCHPNVHLLINEGIELEGFKIWASPWTPKFGNWSFMYRRGEPAAALWSMMPDDTDMAITHGPVRRKLDAVPEFNTFKERVIYRYTGCVELEERIKAVGPAVHMCGHIHEGWGHVIQGPTTYLNSSIMDERYQPVNKPQAFEMTRDDEGKAKCRILFKTSS